MELIISYLEEAKEALLAEINKKQPNTDTWECYLVGNELGKLLAVHAMVSQVLFILRQEDYNYSWYTDQQQEQSLLK